MYRSKAYLDYIRRKPCVICGRKPTHPAHGEGGGKGLKASDLTAIPLCAKHHMEEHQRGIRSFWIEKPHPRQYYVELLVDDYATTELEKLPAQHQLEFLLEYLTLLDTKNI